MIASQRFPKPRNQGHITGTRNRLGTVADWQANSQVSDRKRFREPLGTVAARPSGNQTGSIGPGGSQAHIWSTR